MLYIVYVYSIHRYHLIYIEVGGWFVPEADGLAGTLGGPEVLVGASRTIGQTHCLKNRNNFANVIFIQMNNYG